MCAAVPEAGLALKPDNFTFEQAAAVPTSGSIALRNLAARAGSRLDKVCRSTAQGVV